MNITKLSRTTFSHPILSQRYLKLQNHAFISHSIFFLNIHPFSHPHFSDIHLTGCLFCNNVVFCAITKACHTNISKFFLQLNCRRSHNIVNAFFFFKSETKDMSIMIKSTREGWEVLLTKYKLLITIRLNTSNIEGEIYTKAYTNLLKTRLNSSQCYPPLLN